MKDIMDKLRNPVWQSVLNGILVPVVLAGIYGMISLHTRFAVLEAVVQQGMADRYTGSQGKSDKDLAREQRYAIEIRVIALEKVVSNHIGRPWHDDAGLELAKIRERLKAMDIDDEKDR